MASVRIQLQTIYKNSTITHRIIGGVVFGVTCLYLAYRINEKRYKFNAYTTSQEAANNIDLSGKYAIITGCSSGIGMETAKTLIDHGCVVIMANRNITKSEKVKKEMIESLNANVNKSDNKIDANKLIIICSCDVSSLRSVKEFATNTLKYLNKYNISKIDYLINNAGSSKIKPFMTNYMGHFYLTMLLLPKLKQKSRIITLSSIAYMFAKYEKVHNMIDYAIKNKCNPSNDKEHNNKTLTMYEMSKLYQILFTKEFHKRYFEKLGIQSCVVHPGMIVTPLVTTNNPHALRDKFVFYFIGKSISQGAATTVRCVCMGENEIESGHYYMDCCEADYLLSGICKNDKNGLPLYDIDTLQTKLWNLSEIILKEQGLSF